MGASTMKAPRPHASVIVGVESTDELKLNVKLIHIVDGDAEMGDLVFKWFVQSGNTIEEARENCLGSIAFYARCRPDLRDAILKALEPEAAREVCARLGIAREEKEDTRSRR
jgi:hypothetical protein